MKVEPIPIENNGIKQRVDIPNIRNGCVHGGIVAWEMRNRVHQSTILDRDWLEKSYATTAETIMIEALRWMHHVEAAVWSQHVRHERARSVLTRLKPPCYQSMEAYGGLPLYRILIGGSMAQCGGHQRSAHINCAAS